MYPPSISLTTACTPQRVIEIMLDGLGYYTEANGVNEKGCLEVGTAVYTVGGRVVVKESVNIIREKILILLKYSDQ